MPSLFFMDLSLEVLKSYFSVSGDLIHMVGWHIISVAYSFNALWLNEKRKKMNLQIFFYGIFEMISFSKSENSRQVFYLGDRWE